MAASAGDVAKSGNCQSLSKLKLRLAGLNMMMLLLLWRETNHSENTWLLLLDIATNYATVYDTHRMYYDYTNTHFERRLMQCISQYIHAQIKHVYHG